MLGFWVCAGFGVVCWVLPWFRRVGGRGFAESENARASMTAAAFRKSSEQT